MSLDWTNLVSQGRAKAYGVAFSVEETDFRQKLELERGLSRIDAANFVRAGVASLKEYDEAVEKGLHPEVSAFPLVSLVPGELEAPKKTKKSKKEEV